MGSLLLRFLSLVAALVLVVSPVQAVLNDDRYDGNIYALYAGNGSLVPPPTPWGSHWPMVAPRSSSITSMTVQQANASHLLCLNCSVSGDAASTCFHDHGPSPGS